MKRMMLVLGLVVCGLMMFGGNVLTSSTMAEELDLRKLRLLAKKLEAPINFNNERVEKQIIDEFEILTPTEVFELRKIHRKVYWPKYARKMNKKRVFSSAEKIDKILFQAIEEEFGSEATLYNLPDEQISWLMDEMMNLEEMKQLITDLENGLNGGKGCKRCYEEQRQAKIGTLGASCDYVPNWNFIPYKDGGNGYRGYACDRVKNDSNDWICDFRIYAQQRNYREVDGYSLAGACVVRKHGGLGISLNKDRFLVGWGAVVKCAGLPVESWVKYSIIFRE